MQISKQITLPVDIIINKICCVWSHRLRDPNMHGIRSDCKLPLVNCCFKPGKVRAITTSKDNDILAMVYSHINKLSIAKDNGIRTKRADREFKRSVHSCSVACRQRHRTHSGKQALKIGMRFVQLDFVKKCECSDIQSQF